MRRFGSVLVAAALVAGAAGCKKESKVVRIGQAAPLTGDQAVMGQYQSNGALLAIEEANAKGDVLPGMKLELVSQDDQHNATQAIAVAKKYASDPDVMGVVGHLNSSCTEPASQIYNEASIVAITASSTNPAITQHGYTTIYRTCATDDVQGPAAAKYAIQVLGAKKIYLLDDKTTYGAGIAGKVEDAVKGFGGTVIAHDAITQGDKDFSAILTKVQAAKPDLIFYGGMFPEASLLIKQAREKKIPAMIMGGDGTFDPALIKLATAESAEGFYCTYTTADIEKMETAKAFVESYRKRFNAPPGDYSAQAYDAANLIIDAVRRAGKKDRKAVAEAMKATKNFPGAIGVINYKPNGDPVDESIYVYQVKAGKWEYLSQVL